MHPKTTLICAFAFPIALAVLFVACVPAEDEPETEPEQSFCQQHGWTERAFDREGPYGEFRHNLADSFKVELLDGSDWKLRDNWSGCV